MAIVLSFLSIPPPTVECPSGQIGLYYFRKSSWASGAVGRWKKVATSGQMAAPGASGWDFQSPVVLPDGTYENIDC